MQLLNSRIRQVDQLAFGHEGRLYGAGTWYGEERYRRSNRGLDVFEVPGGAEPVGRLFPDRVVNGFALNPAGRWLYASADGERYNAEDTTSGYFAVDTLEGQPAWLGLHSWYSFRLAAHPSGEWLVAFGCVGNWRDTRVVRWRQPPGATPVREWAKDAGGSGECWQVVCDPLRPRLITLGYEQAAAPGFVRGLVVRSAADWSVTDRVPVAARSLEQLTVSPDGSCLAARHAASLLVWDAADLARPPRKVRGGIRHFTGIAFHPSGRYLAATGNDETVRLYDTETWQLAKTFTWDIGRMRSVAFSPDGRLAAAGGDTGKVVVWDVDV